MTFKDKIIKSIPAIFKKESHNELQSEYLQTLMSLLDFCNKYYCQENIYFLIDVINMKNKSRGQNDVNLIYHKYFDRDCEYELNLPSKTLSQIRSSFLVNPTVSMFDDAYQHIKYIVDTDILPRFHSQNTFNPFYIVKTQF